MGHTNYNNMSNKTKNENVNTTHDQPKYAVDETPMVAVTPETHDQPESIFGTVYDCKNLNIRKHPNTNSQILFTVSKGTKIKIDVESSTAEWYKILVNDQEGFCMKKYISLPQ